MSDYQPFQNFDPLKVADQHVVDESLQLKRIRRSIHSILHSYVGWYDPFAELIQNALDSVDRRARLDDSYEKELSIIVDANAGKITVTDNGIGLDKSAFERFLAPHESFKELDERGSKGVGATYLAYGFNYIRIDTKTKQFAASGEMENARRWLHSENVASNPEVYPTNAPPIDPRFSEFDAGVSVTLGLDASTKPSDLTWPGLSTAESWFVALSVKTALGAVVSRQQTNVVITYVDKDGQKDEYSAAEIGYMSPHRLVGKSKSYQDVQAVFSETVQKKGLGAPLPASIRNLDCVFLDAKSAELIDIVTKMTVEEREFAKRHEVRVNASYMYGATVWELLAKKVGYRRTAGILGPGIQLATDNMPQGELIQIPLTRYTGRQNQVHILMHFSNCTVDLGRKGFDKQFVDFAKSVSAHLVQDSFSKFRSCLKTEDVKKTPLLQSEKVANWKKNLSDHEHQSPLELKNDNFFLPINEISISSEPSREQDVVALFNQLVAGGVIRGIKVVGTNEMMTYDGAFRIRIGPDFAAHEYDEIKNPLGISETRSSDMLNNYPSGFISTDLKVLEYKYTLDGLIQDISTGDKKSAEIDLVIAWESGEDYRKYFHIRSYLGEESIEERQYHGVTHALFDENGSHVMDAILLRDLIWYLNDPIAATHDQERYDLED